MSKHRSASDTEELKKQIKSLKRKISRLEKQVIEGIPVNEEILIKDMMEEKDEKKSEPSDLPFACPRCNSLNVGQYTSPKGRILKGCKNCKKWKG